MRIVLGMMFIVLLSACSASPASTPVVAEQALFASADDVFAVIEASLAADNARDREAYVATFHPESDWYLSALGSPMGMGQGAYTTLEVIDFDAAQVRVAYEGTSKFGAMSGTMTLRKAGDAWLIYDIKN